MASPMVKYLADYSPANLNFPSFHMGRCDKIIREGPVKVARDWMTGQGFCRKPGKAEIRWTFPDTTIVYYFCDQHLDDKIRYVFKNGVVHVLRPDGGVVAEDLDKLLTERAQH